MHKKSKRKGKKLAPPMEKPGFPTPGKKLSPGKMKHLETVKRF